MRPAALMCPTLRSPAMAVEQRQPPWVLLLRTCSDQLMQSLRGGLVGALFALGTQFAATDVAAATDSAEAIECLALTMYFEARGEPDIGKMAVAHVVVNRTRDARFPRRICDVARQQSSLPNGGCQFSWTCDEFGNRPRDGAAWRRSKTLARQVYYGLSRDPTGGALWYHADYVDPPWRRDLAPPQRIGRHMFYRDASASTLAGKAPRQHLDAASTPWSAGEGKRGWTLGQRPDGEFFSLMKQAVASSAPWASSLAMSLHVYSNDKARRFVRINHAIYAEGDWLASGIRLEAITLKGVVLRRGNEQYAVLLQ